MKISKAKVDEFIGKAKRYLEAIRKWDASETEFETVKSLCRDLFDRAEETFGFLHGHAMFDVVLGMCRVKPDMAHEDIYKVLEVLGYEVTE